MPISSPVKLSGSYTGFENTEAYSRLSAHVDASSPAMEVVAISEFSEDWTQDKFER